MIIDFRVRPPFKSFCKLNIYGARDPNPDPVTAPGVWLDVPPFRSFDDRSIERFIEEMDEAGIDVAVAMGRNSPHRGDRYSTPTSLSWSRRTRGDSSGSVRWMAHRRTP